MDINLEKILKENKQKLNQAVLQSLPPELRIKFDNPRATFTVLNIQDLTDKGIDHKATAPEIIYL